MSDLPAQKASSFISEDSGRFLYLYLGIKEPSNAKTFKKKGGRKVGRGRGAKKPEKGGKPREKKPLTVHEQIAKKAYEIKKQNNVIESDSNTSLRSFKGLKASTTDSPSKGEKRFGSAQTANKPRTRSSGPPSVQKTKSGIADKSRNSPRPANTQKSKPGIASKSRIDSSKPANTQKTKSGIPKADSPVPANTQKSKLGSGKRVSSSEPRPKFGASKREGSLAARKGASDSKPRTTRLNIKEEKSNKSQTNGKNLAERPSFKMIESQYHQANYQ